MAATPTKPSWMVSEDRMSLTLSADGTYYTWSLKEFVEEAHRTVVDDTLRAAMLAEATPALERALQRRVPPAGGWVLPADCSICGAWPDCLRDDMSTNMSATGKRFPVGVERLLWICGDRSERSDERPEMRRCPDCGTYYSIVNYYEWTPIGTDDDDWLTRLKPDQAWPFLPEDEKAALRTRLDLDSDLFPRIPKRADRSAIHAAIGYSDAASAWTALAERGLIPSAAIANPRWTFLEDLPGQRPSQAPPTMKHVVAFAADMPVMLRVEAAARLLVERLAGWGAPSPTSIEWVLRVSAHEDDTVIPDVMMPVFQSLREAHLPGLTLPQPGDSNGWFVRGVHAWREARARRNEPFVSRPDPFEPLAEILRAGYRVHVTEDVIRISCDE